MCSSDWSSDVCSSELGARSPNRAAPRPSHGCGSATARAPTASARSHRVLFRGGSGHCPPLDPTSSQRRLGSQAAPASCHRPRSEEHTSELQSLMRISYAVFCLKKKKNTNKSKQNRHKQTKEPNHNINAINQKRNTNRS